MVNSIQAEIYKLTRRPYFYVLNLCCAAFALLVAGLMCYIKYTASPDVELINFPLAINMLSMGMPIGLYLVAVGGDAVFSEQYKYNTLKNEVSYGLTRVQVYLARLVVTLLLMIVVFVVTIGVYLLASLVLLGIPSDAGSMASFGKNTAQAIQDAFRMLGFYVLASFPLWLGSMSLALALLFLVRSSNLAGFGFLAVMLAVPAILDNLGKYVHPMFHSLYHLTLDYMGGLVISAQNMDWTLMSRCWLVGLAWAAISTAVGLFFFSRREIN